MRNLGKAISRSVCVCVCVCVIWVVQGRMLADHSRLRHGEGETGRITIKIVFQERRVGRWDNHESK